MVKKTKKTFKDIDKNFDQLHISDASIANGKTGRWLVVGNKVGITGIIQGWLTLQKTECGVNAMEVKFGQKLFDFLTFAVDKSSKKEK